MFLQNISIEGADGRHKSCRIRVNIEAAIKVQVRIVKESTSSASPAARPRHSIRIVPRLDIKGANLVKGIHLEGLRVLGKPEHYARKYFEEGADELMYQDVVASLYGRNSLLEIVEKTALQYYLKSG